MRRSLFCLLTATSLLLGVSFSAKAADLPPAPRPVFVPALPPFSWTGFYLGGNLGAGWNHGNISDSSGLFAWGANNSTTFVGGAQVGGNYQINNIVLGLEGDFDWFANSNNSGGGTAFPAAAGNIVQGSNNGRWLTMLTGRVGLAADRLLVYMKGGGAWVGSNNLTLTGPGGGSVSIGNGNTNTGWVAGAGIEWAFAPNWTTKLEYDYVGLSNKSLTVTVPTIGGPVADTFSTNNRNVQMVTVGVNYLFNYTN